VETASETCREVYLDLYEERSPSGDESSELSVDRRSLLKTGGGLSLVGILVSALTQSSGPADDTTAVYGVGPNEEYQTIQAAYNALDATGGRIVVRHNYDSATESFPVEMNQTDRDGNGIPFTLRGDDVSETRVDASGSGADVFKILGLGSDYQRKVVVSNLQIVGGQTGITVTECPYSHLHNVVLNGCNDHGVHLASGGVGNYGFTFDNVEAWSCGRNGFRLEEHSYPNAVTFKDCEAMLCGQADSDFAGVHLRNSSVRWIGGVVQQNYGYGIDLRNSNAPYVGGVYFEGNGLGTTAPLDIYLGATRTDDQDEGPGVYAPTIQSCYFNGAYYYQDHFKGREMALRAINIQKAFAGEVRSCAYRNYSESFVTVFGDSKGPNSDVVDFDLNRASHWNVDSSPEGTPFLSKANGHRLRSGGTVLKQDLVANRVVGRYDGDRAIHDGNGPPLTAIWSTDDETWYLPDGTSIQE
jgi:hypothetical protein